MARISEGVVAPSEMEYLLSQSHFPEQGSVLTEEPGISSAVLLLK